MAVITNRNTSQAPMTATGSTGTQTVIFIPAARVYIKTPSATELTLQNVPVVPVAAKSNGTTPAGWTDLGTMLDNAPLTYSKNVNKIRTGVDKVVRAVYVDTKDATIKFSLAQTDDVAMGFVSGLTGSVVSAGSTINFKVGQEDVVQQALLCVYQNKIDGKEVQLYHPAAMLSFVFAEVNNQLALQVTADLLMFMSAGETVEQIMGCTFFA